MITEDELKELIRDDMDPFDSLRKWAYSKKVSPSMVCQVLGGKVPVTPGLARVMGYRRVVRFERIETE
jgi:hypothetical protein